MILEKITKKILKECGFLKRDKGYSTNEEDWEFIPKEKEDDNFFTIYHEGGSKLLRVLYEKIIFVYDFNYKKPYLDVICKDPQNFVLHIRPNKCHFHHSDLYFNFKSRYNNEVHFDSDKNIEKNDRCNIRNCYYNNQISLEFYISSLSDKF